MEQKKAGKKGRILGWIALGAVIAGLVALYFWMDARGYLAVFESTESLQEFVSSFGMWAPLVFILLQIAQVICAPIPGNVTTLAGGAMFGFWPAMAYSVFAVFVGSMIAFGIGRWCGKPVIYRLASPAIVDKYLVVLATKQRLTLALLFLFPFFPDDVLCLLAGLTGYSWGWFAGMVLLTRPWGLVFSALVGSGALSMPLWGWIVIALVAIAAMVLSIKYGSRLEDWLLSRIRRKNA